MNDKQRSATWQTYVDADRALAVLDLRAHRRAERALRDDVDAAELKLLALLEVVNLDVCEYHKR
jgi:hypothetical protein